MGKQVPRLTLVGKDNSLERGLGISEGLNFVAVEELGTAEAKRIERMLKTVCQRAGLIAVALTSRSWDNRPVVVLADEDGPTIIRCIGPEAAANSSLNSRVREVLERLSRFPDLAGGMLDWGIFEDQIWFRRNLVNATLAHNLSAQGTFKPDELSGFLERCIDTLSDWHSHGVIHGHITTSNIVVRGEAITFLDAAVAAAVVQAAKKTAASDLNSYAPEVPGSATLDYSTDVFGLGQVLRRILVSMKKNYQLSEHREAMERVLERYSPLVESMLETDPQKRPTLSEVRAFQKQVEKPAVKAEQRKESALKGKSLTTGRVVQPGENREREAQRAVPPRKSSSGVHTKPETPLYEEDAPRTDDDEFSLDSWHNGAAKEETGEESYFDFESGAFVGAKAEEESREPAPRTPKRTSPKQEPSFWTFSLILGFILLGIWYYMRGARPDEELTIYTPNELLVLWESKIPSKMSRVAEIAVAADSQENLASDLIVRSVNNGDPLPGGVDSGLLRVAFNSKWEMELTLEDRRMALALGLAGLLREKLPHDLGPLDQRHPGIILGVTASAGENVKRVLKNVPAQTLSRLAPPFGPAFTKLLQGRTDVNCADQSVMLLARLSTHGVEKSQDLAAFLAPNPNVNLHALALMYSTQNDLAKQALDVLLNHPNIVLDYPEVVWGREWKLADWHELEPGDQLFVLAGVQPSEAVSAANVGKLFMHPSATMRAYAIEQALDRIKFNHPGTFETMQLIKSQPDILTPEQLFRLAEILENPAKALTEERLQKWLESGPSLKVVTALLLSTTTAREASPIDPWLAMHLRSSNWDGDVLALRKLSSHPNDYTRVYAYQQIFKMKDGDTARTFLRAALSKERNAEFKQQLEQMITILGRNAGAKPVE